MRARALFSAGALLASACEFAGSPAPINPPLQPITCGDAGPDRIQIGDASDNYDCMILESVGRYVHPDAMLIKAQIAQESGFRSDSISADSPCGVHDGWTDEESKSFGLTQVTPACGEADSLLKPDGHPNLTTDMQSSLWATSVYNPGPNIDEGVRACVNFRSQVMSRYPGCTEAEYNLMSAGAYNSGANSVIGCGMYTSRAAMYVDLVLAHYATFARSAGWPNPY